MSLVYRFIGSFCAALSFFTILPDFSGNSGVQGLKDAKYSMALVGLALGLGLALVSTLGNVAPFLMLVYLGVITAFLHLDGLADSFDALFSHRSKDQMLAIMKDSRIGAMGATAIVLALLGKYTAFVHLNDILLLIALPSLARFSAVVAGAALPYAGKSGLGEFFTTSWKLSLLPQVLPAVLLLFFAAGIGRGFFILSAWALVVSLVILWHRRKLGGITGDGMGAMIEISEVSLFLVAIL
jgi:adenosylcobinamide-GDP ribazoletransferase